MRFAFRFAVTAIGLLVSSCAAPSPGDDLESSVLESNASPLPFRKLLHEDGILPPPKSPSTTLTRAEALEDVRFFRHFVKYAYAPRVFRETVDGFDFEGPMSELEARVAAREQWTVGDLFEELRHVLVDVIRDGHVALALLPHTPGSPPLVARGDRHWNAYVFDDRAAATALDPDACALPARSMLLPAQKFLLAAGPVTQPVLLAEDSLTSVDCRGAAMTLHELAPSSITPPSEFSARELDSSTYYVRIHTFAPLQPALGAAFVASANEARRYEKVILDLRGNGGGNPEFFMQWAIRLGLSGTLRAPRSVEVTSFAQTLLRTNTVKILLSRPDLDPTIRERLEALLPGLQATLDGDFAREDFTRFTAPDTAVPDIEVDLPGGFAGKLEVLVDARCGSACDSAAAMAKALPNVELLSETNTMGLMMSGEPLPLVLPSSTIAVNVPVLVYSNPERNAREGIGVTPTIWLDHDTMAASYP